MDFSLLKHSRWALLLCSFIGILSSSVPAMPGDDKILAGPFANYIDDTDHDKDKNLIDGLHLGMAFRAALASKIHWYPTGRPDEFSNEKPSDKVAFPKVTVHFTDNIMTRILVYTDSEAMARQLSIHALHLIGDTFKDVTCEEDTKDTLYGPDDYMWVYSARNGVTDVNMDVDEDRINFGIVMQYEPGYNPA